MSLPRTGDATARSFLGASGMGMKVEAPSDTNLIPQTLHTEFPKRSTYTPPRRIQRGPGLGCWVGGLFGQFLGFCSFDTIASVAGVAPIYGGASMLPKSF